METTLDFHALHVLIDEYKKEGKSLEEVLSFIEGDTAAIGALITPKGQSPWKTVTSLTFTQRGALELMLKAYIPTIY